MLGGGSLPTQELPSFAIVVPVEGRSASWIAQRLRNAKFGLIGRVHKDQFFIDMRTVFPSQDATLVEVIETLNSQPETE